MFRDAIIHSPPREVVKADVLIDGEKIAKIGKLENDISPDIPVYANKIILPGFVDSHIHLLEHGLSLLFPDLREITSKEAFYDVLAANLPRARSYGFLYGFNLAPERLAERYWEPLTSDLDKVDKALPIFIRREDGHTVYLNTQARQWLLYDQPLAEADTPLYGRFNELSVERMQQRVPADVRREGFIKGSADLLALGVTAAGVMIGNETSLDDVRIIRSLDSDLGIEVGLFPQNRDIAKVCSLDLTRLGGCILIDGSFGSHTAALREPYTDAPGNMGILYFSQRELDVLVKCVHSQDLQMAFHAIGDEAVRVILNAYEKTIDPTNPRRHRIEHAELIGPDLIERASQLHLILSVQPMFEHIWGQEDGMYAERLGDRRRWTNPYRSLLDAGIRIAAGSDAPITTPDPAQGISAFLNHPVAEERITPEEAVAAYTYHGAYAMHMEDKIGSITPSLVADILVYDADPFETLDFRPSAVISRGKIEVGQIEHR